MPPYMFKAVFLILVGILTFPGIRTNANQMDEATVIVAGDPRRQMLPLAPGATGYYRLDASSCLTQRYLHVELWDTGPATKQGYSSKADPMLMLRPRALPEARYDQNSEANKWHWSPFTLTDVPGYMLLRSYHHIVLDLLGCEGSQFYSECQQPGSEAQLECRVDQQSGTYYVAVYNVDIFLAYPLQFQLRATCSMTPPCSAPSEDGRECSGRGECLTIHDYDSPSSHQPAGSADNDDDDVQDNRHIISSLETCETALCRCVNSWGDIGCNQYLKYLPFGISNHMERLPVHRWAYYEIVVEHPVSSLLVELRRISGDPVLFVKPKFQGYVPGGVPTISDFEQFADVEGFRSRINYHFRLLQNVKPGVYYVAVFNNDAALRDEASYHIQALIPPLYQSDLHLCPNNCSWPQGTCSQGKQELQRDFDQMCTCSPDFAGITCEGPLMPMKLSTTYMAELAPASWMFFHFNLTGDSGNSVKRGLSIGLYKKGGFPDLVIKKDKYPRLMDSDFKFKTGKEYESESHFRVKSSDLFPGTYYVGIYNTDYDVHSPCEFRLRISYTEDDMFLFNPTMSIVLGVLCTMFLCLMMSLCKRVLYRNMRGSRAHNRAGAQLDGQQVLPGVRSVWGNQENAAGLDAELVESFPTFTYEENTYEKEDAQCSVCLCDYEALEVLRTLPLCDHSFHKSCIDQWLQSHSTCPLCRVELNPGANTELTEVNVPVGSSHAAENVYIDEVPADGTSQQSQATQGSLIPGRALRTTSFGMESVAESDSIAPGYGNAPVRPVMEQEMASFTALDMMASTSDLHLSGLSTTTERSANAN